MNYTRASMLIILSLTINNTYAIGDKALILKPGEITIRVVEETGDPITNAYVNIGFGVYSDGWKGVYKSTRSEGVSDSNGIFAASAETTGYIGVTAKKDGYYNTFKEINLRSGVTSESEFRFGAKWPLMPVQDVMLRRKVNPIPMLAKRVYTQIPKPDQEFAYDFEVGDWVAPLGQGKASDAYFKVEGYWNGHRDNDATLTMRFPGSGDGLARFEALSRESAFRSPYKASLDGYSQEKRWRKGRIPNPHATGHSNAEIVTIDRNKDANYFFRIRTRLDDAGKVESALYGKIYGDVEFGGAGEQGGYLKIGGYYLNPTPNDSNVEFDPTQNLFTNLSSDEEVHEP